MSSNTSSRSTSANPIDDNSLTRTSHNTPDRTTYAPSRNRISSRAARINPIHHRVPWSASDIRTKRHHWDLPANVPSKRSKNGRSTVRSKIQIRWTRSDRRADYANSASDTRPIARLSRPARNIKPTSSPSYIPSSRTLARRSERPNYYWETTSPTSP